MTVILCFVKTAISLPDGLFERTERAARRLGLNRSQLVATALEHWLGDEGPHEDEVTVALDRVHSDLSGSADGAAAGRMLVDSDQWTW